MQNLVRLTLIAACLCAATGTPLPAPAPAARRADHSDQSEAYAASEDHLFNDEGFPLRASARVGDAGSNPDSESRGFAGHRGQYKGYRRPASPVPAELRAGDQPPFNDPFSGFFFDMQDMMKILRDQMSVVLSRVPPKSMNGDDGPLSFVPSDVRNQTTTKVDFVDGHKVVINDTTYSNGDTNSGSIFHVQIVDLLPLDEDGEGPSVGAPSPKQPTGPQRPNELDSNNRDVEELEDDDDEIGEDIDEAPKKDVAKEKGKKPAVAPKPKPGDKEQDTGSKGPRAESGKGKEKDVEEVEVVADGVEDEPEGEDIPDLEERNKQQADSLLKAESRWENEIDNRIDSYQPYTDYQPYYNTYRPTGNYYEPQRTSQPIYNHQPGFNAHGPRYFTSRPVYNTNSPNYKSYQQDYNSYRPNYNSFDSNNNQFVDLSGDTKVNDFMAAQQQAGLIMADPDAEIIDIHKRPVPKFQYPQYNYRNY